MNAFRRSASQRFLAVGLTVLLLIPNLLAQSGVNQEAKTRVLDRMNQILTNYAYVPGVDFSQWPKMLEEQKEAIDKANDEESFVRAVNGALGKFGFSHIGLQTPNAARMRREGQTVGIGITLQQQEDGSGFLVVRVVPKSPAEEAKLQPGDLLLEANGKPIKAHSDLLGKEGEQITLKVKAETGDFRTITITRRKFSTVRPEELEWVDADTAILRVYTFDLSYNADRVESLMKDAAKAKELIIDLRNNGGGLVLNVQHFLGLLLPKDSTAGTFINKRLAERFAEETGGKGDDVAGIAKWSKDRIKVLPNDTPVFRGRVAVLVNGATGSGAEISAATLREELDAPVIGTKSAGAVLVALIVPVSEGYSLIYPIQDYVTNKGFRIEKNGVVPDVEVKDPKAIIPGRPDAVVDAAVIAVTKRASELKCASAETKAKAGA